MLWGGRFKENLNNDAMEFSSSLSFDINLLEEDINVSIAHAEMLAKVGIISEAESQKIVKGLKEILNEGIAGRGNLDVTEFEDIHSVIEHRLFELIGDTAGKLHTGRSRNDQVATGFRLWIKKGIKNLSNQIIELQRNLVKVSEDNTETIMPGYTHLQRAQPISLAFHFLAYVLTLHQNFPCLSCLQAL